MAFAAIKAAVAWMQMPWKLAFFLNDLLIRKAVGQMTVKLTWTFKSELHMTEQQQLK